MAQIVGLTGAAKPRKDLYLRATAAYVRPTTLAEVATLLGTAIELGKFEDKTKKNSIKKGDTKNIDDGSVYVQEYISSIEGTLLNATPANVDDFNSTYDNVYVDVILDDPANQIIKVYNNLIVHGEEDEVDGDANVLLISGTKKSPAKATLRDTFDYSAFV